MHENIASLSSLIQRAIAWREFELDVWLVLELLRHWRHNFHTLQQDDLLSAL